MIDVLLYSPNRKVNLLMGIGLSLRSFPAGDSAHCSGLTVSVRPGPERCGNHAWRIAPVHSRPSFRVSPETDMAMNTGSHLANLLLQHPAPHDLPHPVSQTAMQARCQIPLMRQADLSY
ncbi:MAG: hypothetical protein ACRCVZ_09290 [Aestuariivirga sp.]